MAEQEIAAEQVAANRKARDAARQVWELACEESKDFKQRASEEFWRFLAGVLKAAHPKLFLTKSVPITPMSPLEAKRFAHERMQFGQHAGNLIGDVPLDYLDWLAAQPDFHSRLNRYLRSEAIELERQQTDG